MPLPHSNHLLLKHLHVKKNLIKHSANKKVITEWTGKEKQNEQGGASLCVCAWSEAHSYSGATTVLCSVWMRRQCVVVSGGRIQHPAT